MNKFKKKVTMFTTMLAFLTVSCAAVNAAGIADNTVLGKTSNMDIQNTSATRMDVNLIGNKAGDVGQVDWSKFNVGAGERVNFGFSNVSQTVINRVLGGQQSKILGQMTNSCVTGNCAANAATSKVILINPAGVMFGAGSMVDLNSFTASTFDFKGAKNLKDMSATELADYQAGTLNKLSPVANVNGTTLNKGYINFDSNYTQAFEDAGINMSQFAGQTQINLDNAKFGHFNRDANDNLLDSFDSNNPNKSVNIVSDNITYRDSLIRTGGNNNYVTNNGTYTSSNSNVRLVTADGVTFGYVANGYSDGRENVANDTKTNVTRNITMDNTGLDAGTPAINSGDVKIVNKSNADGSNIKIKETFVKADKLLNMSNNGEVSPSAGGEHGNVTILGTGDIEISHSRLESNNTALGNRNTNAQAGGEINIHSVGKTTIDNSLLKSAGVDKANFNDNIYVAEQGGVNTSGMVNIDSVTDDVNINGTRILAQEDANITATNDINFNNSLIKAKSDISNSSKDVNFEANRNININNGAIAGNNINLDATASGNVNITSSTPSVDYASGNVLNGQDKSLLKADNNINIKANNTKIKDSSLAYNNMKLYDNDYTNNVTVEGNVTLTPNTGKDLNIETNGNLTFNNANVYYGEQAEINVSTNDNGTIDGIPYQVNVKGAKADNITGKSTQNNVNVKNSNLDTNKDINLVADKGSVNIDNSDINAGQDANITAYNTIAFGTGKNITPTADINAGRNVNITSTNGDITAEKTDMGDIEYGNRLTFDAKGDNIFTSADSLKSVNVDFKAGGANRIYTTGDAQFVNSSFEAPNNFVESGSDVILNNHTIKSATPNAKDTKTQIFANGNVTTDNVTGEDLTANGGTFPQSVDYQGSAVGPNGSNTTLNINKTKLTVETQTVKDPTNPDNGSIKLDVQNADNPNAGLDLVAKNVDSLDKDPTGGYNKPGYFKAGDSKWDENIAPKEGPEVTLNAVDNNVSIANIETDKLNLDPNDKMIADNTNGTPKIEVKDQGGFNLDPTLDYNPDKTGTGFTYDENYKIKDKTVEGGDLTMGDWSEWEPTGREWTDPDGTKHVEYQSTRDGRITDRITTQTEQEHKITFDNDGNPSQFTLVYDKKDTIVEPGREIKASDVKDDPSIVPPGKTPEDFIKTKIEKESCPPAPTITPEDSYIDAIKLPREITETSKSSKVTDNTVDQSENVMAAAAKVDIVEEGENSLDDEDEEEFLE